MELRVLGALEIWHDGTPVLLRAAKPRQLLTLLATRPGKPVPARVLIDELWEGRAPATAASALRVHVTQVRRVLEPDQPGPSTRLPLCPSGYVLRVAPDELDSGRFESLVIAAHEANQLGDPMSAESRLVQALALWRGAPLADAQGLSAVAAELAHLEALRVRAIEDLADARLALGQHAALIELLLDATDEFPLHETFAAQLMLALYRSGRQADALRTFGNLARELDLQLGIAPSERLRRLEEDILLQRPHLERPSCGPDEYGATSSRFVQKRIVGRRDELRRLLGAQEAAASGERCFVLLSGPSGIGKTTLASAFCTRARHLGASVFAGACVAERVGGYEAVSEILQAVSHEIANDRALDLEPLESNGRGDRDQFEMFVGSDPGSEQLRLFQTIAAAIRALGDRPVVLLVEDLHWASTTTLLVLRYLMRLSDLNKLLIVATVRDEELDIERSELVADIAPVARTRLLELEGLNDHEVRALIRTATTPSDALIDLTPKIRDVTDGNPFFIRALLRELDESSTDDRAGLEARIVAAAPSGVRALIDRRVARVSTGAREVLESAAILGGEFSLEIVSEVSDLPSGEALEAMEELLARRLLLESAAFVDRFVFPHTLVRNAVYLGIAEARRRDLHRRTAEGLEARFGEAPTPDCAEIAYHYCEATTDVPAPDAATWAALAASEAAHRFAFAEAAEWNERALHLSADTDAPGRGATYFALGLACDGSRQFSRALAAYVAAAACAVDAGDGRLLSDIAIAAAPAWTSALDAPPDVQRLVENALDLLDGDDPRRRIQLLSRLATLMHYVDPERQRHLVQEACALAQPGLGGTSVAMAMLARHLWLTRDPSACRRRLETARHAFGIACEDSNAATQLRVERELLTDLLENGEIDAFDEQVDAYEVRAKTGASARDIYWSMALHATQETLRGDLSMAEQLARGAQIRGRELYQDAGGAEFLQRFVLRYQQGRLSELVGVLRQGTRMQQPGYRAGSALAAIACAETGQEVEGARIARWALGAEGTGIQKDILWLGAHAMLCGVAWRANDVELARVLDDLIAPCSDHIVVFGAGGAVLGPAHYWRGLVAATLGDLDRAVEHLSEATRMSEQIRAPFWIAQAQVDLAAVLTKRGQRSSGPAIRELTERALATAVERGFGRIVAQAEMLR